MPRGYHREYRFSSCLFNRWSKDHGGCGSLIFVDVTEWIGDEVIYGWIIFDLWPWFPSLNGWYNNRRCHGGVWVKVKRWWQRYVTDPFVPKWLPVKNWDQL